MQDSLDTKNPAMELTFANDPTKTNQVSMLSLADSYNSHSILTSSQLSS